MKKSVPLAILQVLQPILDQNLEIIKAVKSSEDMFYIVDNDENSDFFFKVVRQEASNKTNGYIISYKPTSKDNVAVATHWTELKDIDPRIKSWVKIIDLYNSINTIYDDPILKNNQKRFEKDYKLLDEDANSSSFNLTQLLFLDEYLETARTKLANLKLSCKESLNTEIAALEDEALQIKNDLTKQTKNQILKRLTKFWAKAQKTGLEIIKEVFVNMATEITKKLLLTGGEV